MIPELGHFSKAAARVHERSWEVTLGIRLASQWCTCKEMAKGIKSEIRYHNPLKLIPGLPWKNTCPNMSSYRSNHLKGLSNDLTCTVFENNQVRKLWEKRKVSFASILFVLAVFRIPQISPHYHNNDRVNINSMMLLEHFLLILVPWEENPNGIMKPFV